MAKMLFAIVLSMLAAVIGWEVGKMVCPPIKTPTHVDEFAQDRKQWEYVRERISTLGYKEIREHRLSELEISELQSLQKEALRFELKYLATTRP